MSRTCWVLATLLFAACARAGGPLNVRDFGAIGDGKSLDTAAIQKAIDAAFGAGGGTVWLPSGTFLSGTLVLKSNVTLHLEAGAVLRGSRDIRQYPDHTPQVDYLYRSRFTKHLIYADRADNIAITGRGLIDGQGEHFKAAPGDDKGRPYILRFSECRNVRVRDVSFRNSARWLSHYLACENVVIDGITIHSRIRENRDGIDIDSCTDVSVSNCHVFTGDDAIVLKSTIAGRPCRRVTIVNCTLSSMASALKLGTESNGGFEDVTVSNCVVYDTGYSGIGIMMVDGARLERVTFSDITMRNVRVPIFIRLGNRARPIPGHERPGVGTLRDVVVRNVQASDVGSTGCSVTGIPGHRVENVTLESIRIVFAGGGPAADTERTVPEREEGYPSGRMFGTLPAYGFYCRHAKNLKLRNVDLSFAKEDARPAVVCDDVEDVDIAGLRAEAAPAAEAVLRFQDVRDAFIRGCRPHGQAKAFLHVTGKMSSGIVLSGNDLRRVREPWTKGETATDGAVVMEK